MAKLYVTEFNLPVGNRGLNMAYAPPSVDQTPVAITAGSVQSAAFDSQTCVVRLHADAICSVAFGANPTATANSFRMAANQTEYFFVVPGQKVAVITNT